MPDFSCFVVMFHVQDTLSYVAGAGMELESEVKGNVCR